MLKDVALPVNADLAEKVVCLTRGKTGRPVIIPMAKPIYELLALVDLVIARTGKQAKKERSNARRRLCSLSFHNLRHIFVTALNISLAMDSVVTEVPGQRSAAINTQAMHLPIEPPTKTVKQLPDFNP